MVLIFNADRVRQSEFQVFSRSGKVIGKEGSHVGKGDPLSVLVVGAGSIGGYFGGLLARAGARVSIVARSDYDVVKERGIRLEGFGTPGVFRPDRVVRDVSEYGEPPDVLLIATKVVPEVDVARIVRPVTGLHTALVIIQNGIHTESPVAEAFPQNELVSGIAHVGIERAAPGVLRRREKGRLVLGRYPSGPSETARTLCDLFTSADFVCEVTETVETARWRKLVWNAAFNPLTALGGGIDTLDVLDDPAARALAVSVMKEVIRVAEAHGHELPASLVQHNLDVTRASGSYKTSMVCDLEAGRPLEVEAILGNAARAARRVGVDVPCIESLYALLRLLDGRIRRASRN